CVDRMVAALRTRRRRLRHHVRFAAGAAWHARRCRRGAAVMARQVERQIKHRGSALWIAAMVHRLSGLALAIFLPLHFLALGLALRGAEAFDTFLAVTRHPAVKLAELGLVVALAVHMTLGLRVLAIEFLPWRDRTAVTVSV